jgi:hypothetical protein
MHDMSVMYHVTEHTAFRAEVLADHVRISIGVALGASELCIFVPDPAQLQALSAALVEAAKEYGAASSPTQRERGWTDEPLPMAPAAVKPRHTCGADVWLVGCTDESCPAF